jgi:hypothetical protein
VGFGFSFSMWDRQANSLQPCGTQCSSHSMWDNPPSGYGLEAMDLCESLFGYWPCLTRENRGCSDGQECVGEGRSNTARFNPLLVNWFTGLEFMQKHACACIRSDTF